MTNKAIEVLTDGSMSEELWLCLHDNYVYSETVAELNEARPGESEADIFALDSNDDLVIDGAVVKTVDSYGGEGQGDDFWVVVSVSKEGEVTRYVKNVGWYASYDGGYFDSTKGTEVFPFKKIATSWSTSKDDLNKTVDCVSSVD